jgi:hypothetical protein
MYDRYAGSVGTPVTSEETVGKDLTKSSTSRPEKRSSSEASTVANVL